MLQLCFVASDPRIFEEWGEQQHSSERDSTRQFEVLLGHR